MIKTAHPLPDDPSPHQTARTVLDQGSGDDSELWDLWHEADMADEVTTIYDEIYSALDP